MDKNVKTKGENIRESMDNESIGSIFDFELRNNEENVAGNDNELCGGNENTNNKCSG